MAYYFALPSKVLEDVKIASKDGLSCCFDSNVEKTDAEDIFGLDNDHTAPPFDCRIDLAKVN